MKPSSVRNYIDKLIELGKLDKESDNQYSLITIVNWSSYQPKKDKQQDINRTAIGQQQDTDKNDNNEENDKNDKKEYSDAFETFWNAYPNGSGKSPAYKAFKKIKDLPDNILEIVEKHKRQEQWLKDKGQFIPHASSWLNQRRWEDELKSIAKYKPKGIDPELKRREDWSKEDNVTPEQMIESKKENLGK